jgi:hypothetical protein
LLGALKDLQSPMAVEKLVTEFLNNNDECFENILSVHELFDSSIKKKSQCIHVVV